MTLTFKNAKIMRATQNRDRKRYQNQDRQKLKSITRTGDVSFEIYPAWAFLTSWNV